MYRSVLAGLGAMALVGVLAACDPPPPTDDFPTAATTGADESLITTVIDHSITVTTPNTTIENTRFTNCANVTVQADNVTVKNSVFEGGRLDNQSNGTIHNGMVAINDTFTNLPGQAFNTCGDHVFYRVGVGGYAASGIRIDRQQEGFRVGGASQGGQDVVITDSWVLIDTFGDTDGGTNHVLPDGTCDGHPDGIQGFDGPHALVQHNTLDEASYGPGTCNDAAIAIFDGNVGGDFFNNLMLGGGFTFRPQVGTFRLNGNRVVDGTWGFGPIVCTPGPGETHVTEEQADNWTATIDANYHVTGLVDPIGC